MVMQGNKVVWYDIVYLFIHLLPLHYNWSSHYNWSIYHDTLHDWLVRLLNLRERQLKPKLFQSFLDWYILSCIIGKITSDIWTKKFESSVRHDNVLCLFIYGRQLTYPNSLKVKPCRTQQGAWKEQIQKILHKAEEKKRQHSRPKAEDPKPWLS